VLRGESGCDCAAPGASAAWRTEGRHFGRGRIAGGKCARPFRRGDALRAAARCRAGERVAGRHHSGGSRDSVLFPQITTIGGWRQDALKWHPNGLAIDVMIPDPFSPEGVDLGNQIAGFALANAQRWNIDHVIWRHAIYLGPKSGSYMPEMGSETANHYDHVHIATTGGGYPTGNEKYFI
jgi:hypothetical protein